MVECHTQKADTVINMLTHLKEKFSKLLFLVGPASSGKTQCLNEISERTNVPYINFGIELSKKLIELSAKQQVLRVSGLTKEIINNVKSETVLVDNIELLFNPELKIDPIRLLLNCSRNTTLVVAFSGKQVGNSIIYAESHHPEYKKFKIEDYEVIPF
jgi:AAA+ ATPase superfamily predicted ATPase